MNGKQQLLDAVMERLGELLPQDEIHDVTAGTKEGKALRKSVPRTSHGSWAAFEGRPDPVELLKDQGKTRDQSLLPIRYQRMAASPFTFYRGGHAAEYERRGT